ncbi:MAG TPA: dTDP-4-keto-6-deoxy-D-glucose epimerase [Gammaproteobacteria bacterium]|nr:dTDP-4-keto-6-deoxy-D-glucose epimerase [Gammaproteobacteria bacterium]
MQFTETILPGAFIVEIDRLIDERGFFARTWCSQEFSEHGLPSVIKQTSTSFNAEKGTLRGMHFSSAPCREGKLVRCTSGRILDVIIDIRPDSPSFLQHIKVELSAQLRNAIYVPPGFAHGYQTLESNSEIFYMMTEEYKPGYSDGFRWNDPVFAIEWPEGKKIIHDRDADYADFDDAKVEGFAGYYEQRQGGMK